LVDSQLVVIVDDRITNLKILERLTASLGAGVEVRTYNDPFEALASAVSECPDLVIADGRLRDCDGVEFVRRFRAQLRCAEVPVIVVAADEDRELRCRALDAGANDYLTSPVDHREFLARSRTLLSLRRQQLATQTKPSAPADWMVAGEWRQQDAALPDQGRLSRIIDAVPAMIAATDRSGRWVFVNSRFAALVGLAPCRLLGKRPAEIRDDLFFRRFAEHNTRLLAGEILPSSGEEEIIDAAGERRLLLTTKSAFRNDRGEDAMVVTVAIDITERKHAERDLITAKETAEIANRSKTEFLANMSHELRTPLNAIIGFSQVMAGEMLGPMATKKYIGYARDIAASAEHLLGIINDILDVSKLEAGKLDLVEEPIDLPRSIRDVMRLVEQKARAGEVRITLEVDRDLPLLRADIRKVKQILLNIIGNAIKFSHPGGAIEISARSDSGAIVIAVVDHGIGMDADELEVAVSRFGQVASAWSRKHAGTGLGLPLAIGLSELHGGRLTVESSKGAGTTVAIRFPGERSEYPAVLAGPESRMVGGS
jgi:two-component system, cell cycle sensor histidine kinase PleC